MRLTGERTVAGARPMLTAADRCAGRSRLLDSAVRAFGRHGPEGASTRAIARDADAVMSSITYHFGGKSGLYLAAVAYAADRLGADSLSDLLEEAEPAEFDADGARRMIQRIVGALAAKMIDASSTDDINLLLREEMNPNVEVGRLHGEHFARATRALVPLIERATGGCDAEIAKLTAISFLGQAAALRTAKGSTSFLFDSGVPEDLYAIQLAANVDAILDRLGASPSQKG